MNPLILKLEKRFNQFSLRERILICITLLFFVYSIWQMLLYDYALATDEEIAKKAQQIKSQINALENQIDSMAELVGRNPTTALIAQSEALKKENDALDQRVYASTKKMTSAKQMADILNKIIVKIGGLTLVSLESVEAKPLFGKEMSAIHTNSDHFQVYNHGIKIELVGDYFETLAFLQALEKQDINLLWDEINYEVDKYPEAKVELFLHTLSTDAGWLGV